MTTRNALTATDPAGAFIGRWRSSDASERANYQLFLSELCDLLAVPRPEPARADFSRLGKTYTPFPDSRTHDVEVGDLADEKVR